MLAIWAYERKSINYSFFIFFGVFGLSCTLKHFDLVEELLSFDLVGHM